MKIYEWRSSWLRSRWYMGIAHRRVDRVKDSRLDVIIPLNLIVGFYFRMVIWMKWGHIRYQVRLMHETEMNEKILKDEERYRRLYGWK